MSPTKLLQVLTLLVLFVIRGAAFSDQDVQLSETFGEGINGIAFSDITGVKLGQRLSSVTLRGDERVDQVTLGVATPAEVTWIHGGSGGTDKILILGADEYITSMEVHVAKKGRWPRVFYLKVTTNAGNSVATGSKTDESTIVTAPEGFQLSGFFGRAGSEVYELGAIWTRMSATHLALTDNMGAEWYGNKIRNWVGPTIGDAKDSACYRKTEAISSNGVCPLGYNKTDTNCIAQCPLSYPVKCFLECIPQNDDCALEILQKTASVVAVMVNTATAGLFGEVSAAYKLTQKTYMCAASIIGVLKSLIYYLRFQQTTAPQGSVEELLAIAYQADVVLVDLPVAVCTCLGYPVSFATRVAGVVVTVVENIVKQAIINGDQILSSATDVMTFLTNVSALNSEDDSTLVKLQDFLDSNTTCGYQLKSLTDRVSNAVNSIRNATPSATTDDIRVTISRSSLVLCDAPVVTNNCMGEILGNKTTEAAFQTRDLLRKTMGVIIDQLILSNDTDMGASVAKDDSTLEASNLGLVVLAGLDPMGIIWMMSQFVQPTCGPTSFIGEIDDGTLFDALGLTTVDEAFEGSYGSWTREGDGMVNIIFKSTDTKDVTVVIHSGGSNYAEVKVNSCKTTTWNATLAELQDKTMYLDRWRPNIIGIPGSGGGSLVLWVPRSLKGGHLTLHVRINAS
uniref:Jacalin-type lectin domain-containing protein n=1 Tax=Phytophthora ramorum TaxID=164328 RepID=H3GBJ7_PHYRM